MKKQAKDPTSRPYPHACRSMCCGRLECPADCRHLPELRDFEAWRDRRAAKVADPIWSPCYYEATR